MLKTPMRFLLQILGEVQGWWNIYVKLVKRGCSETFSGKLFHKLFSDWHMLDTLCYILYVSIDKHEKGQNSFFYEESEQKQKKIQH